MKKLSPLLLAAVLTAWTFAASAQAMDPGEWEFTTTMTSPMLPKPQSATTSQCISKEDAADPTRFASNDQTQGCTIKPGKRGTGAYEWGVTCPVQGLTGDGKLKYTRNTMEAEIKMRVDMQDTKMDMLSKVSGRWMGACKTK